MSEHGNQTETPNQEGHVTDCLKAIEEYRGQSISEWEAISQISATIRLTTASMDNEQRSPLETHTSQCSMSMTGYSPELTPEDKQELSPTMKKSVIVKKNLM